MAVMRLPRPHIPLAVRVEVAERQLRETRPVQSPSIFYGLDEPMPLGQRLRRLLTAIFGDAKVELHHRPALVNRRRYVRNGKTFYDPPANSPDHLVYLLKPDHDVETRVRGVNGQHSDLALARKRRRKERKAKRRRRKWPAGRKLQSRNTLRRSS